MGPVLEVLSLRRGEITSQSVHMQQFTFSDDAGTTKVIFAPFPISGPPPPASHRGPRLDYQGVQGNFSFLDDQVHILDTPLGSLITVGSLDLESTVRITLVLPAINMAGKKNQIFDTVAIKTQTAGVPIEGAALSYSVLLLHGLAEEIEPLP